MILANLPEFLQTFAPSRCFEKPSRLVVRIREKVGPHNDQAIFSEMKGELHYSDSGIGIPRKIPALLGSQNLQNHMRTSALRMTPPRFLNIRLWMINILNFLNVLKGYLKL